MGLFDIFRRKAKPSSEASESTVVSESTTESLVETSNSQTEASVSEASRVNEGSLTTSESEIILASESQSTSLSETSQVSLASISESELAASEVSEQSLEASTSESESTEPATSETLNETVEETDTATTEEKYDQGLKKSRSGFGERLNRFLARFRSVDEDFFDDLEELMIESDVGYEMAVRLSDELREEVKLQNAKSTQEVSNVIIEKMVELYEEAGANEDDSIHLAEQGPTVIMFVGVNGAGKTTTIGKLAARYKQAGQKVLLAAADTFRAGATEQLEVWARRDGVDIVTGPENSDPAAVVFDAVKKAKDDHYDILFVDTAGRLQNKVNLMNELAKMKRILTREIPSAPHEVLLVLDATTGQNALNQAKLFKESTDVTGIVLTKLDGTARGGIVLAIRNELHLPVKFVGLGEKVTDLEKFDASDFVYGLFKGLVNVQ
ncbi:signal recognition particle-docking protein FtsY [Limosilactobacillus gastricus]|uniref:signal recognition particle-docking protein FtsY n=1 Tax=Limosilactobacillus gastricus TaxID=227942 RepID=UPI0026EFD4D3|nr:signal recognition particle-docking protein FtsY [Limosilactobacillus gastricus]